MFINTLYLHGNQWMDEPSKQLSVLIYINTLGGKILQNIKLRHFISSCDLECGFLERAYIMELKLALKPHLSFPMTLIK